MADGPSETNEVGSYTSNIPTLSQSWRVPRSGVGQLPPRHPAWPYSMQRFDARPCAAPPISRTVQQGL